MDAFTALLADNHAHGAFVLRSDLQAPWSIRVEDRAPLTVVVVARGSCVLVVEGGGRWALSVGDTALVVRGADYTLSDDGCTAPQALIGADQQCTKPDGSPLSDFRDLGVRTWGNTGGDASPDTVLLTGTYERSNQISQRLLTCLPAVVVRPTTLAPPAVSSVVGLLAEELSVSAAGQAVVLDRLVDLLVVSLLRAWFDADAHRPPWYDAHQDPVVGQVLCRMHHEPARPWTLVSLAREVGISRATLARRFVDQVGQPPMSYLSRWRTDLAADLLATTDLTLEAIAGRVGYGSGFALSSAFARRHGCSPSSYRRRTG